MISPVIVQKRNTKMGRVLHVSLPPITSCAPNVPCATGCYALKAWRMYPNSRAAWTHNLSVWKEHSALFENMIAQQLTISKCRLFRWHMSGDIQNYDYLKMMMRLAERFPLIEFLCFTKRYDLVTLLDRTVPSNLTIILSAWPGHPLHNPKRLPVAWMDDGTDDRIPADAIECSGRCDTCSTCWGMGAGNVKFHKH